MTSNSSSVLRTSTPNLSLSPLSVYIVSPPPIASYDSCLFSFSPSVSSLFSSSSGSTSSSLPFGFGGGTPT